MECSDDSDVEKRNAKTAFEYFKGDYSTEPNIIDFHIDQKIFGLNVKTSEAKLSLLRNFEKRVSALRNSEGGILFIHICNKSGNNIRLSDFDQLVDRGLKKLIADGSLFVESYSRKWLSDSPKCEAYPNIIILTVSKSTCVSTVVFNTKVSSDLEVEHPSTFDLAKFICKQRQPVGTEQRVQPEQEVRPFDRGDDWTESRHIQLKTFHLPSFQKFSRIRPNESWSDRFVDYVWSKLRFHEYLTCMSKVPGGGFYIVGVTEASGSNPVNIHGICIEKSERSIIRKGFIEKLKTVTILKPNQSFEPVQTDIIKLSFKNIGGKDNVYLEINVKFVPGIVFCNEGPRAYKLNESDRTIVRMDNVEWLSQILNIAVE